MRTFLGLLVLIGPSASADETKPADAVAADLNKLVGTWDGYVVDGRGEKSDRGPVHLRVTITGTKISAVDLGNGNKDMGTGSFTIDPTKAIKQIDATGVVLPGKRERSFAGIYHVDGDTLRWCVDNRQKDRPTEFRSANGNYLLVLKRKK